MMRQFILTALVALVLVRAPIIPAAAADLTASAGTAAHWRPASGMRWQVQYTGTPLDLTVEADVFKIDLFDTDAALVQELRQRGKHVVCYVNIGAWEDWRPDARRFPQRTLGREYEGWPGERWLDIRMIDLLAPVMRARLALCKAKGFDGVLFDNVDNYMQKTGFPTTRIDQLRYVVWMASEARALGLAVGINNNPGQAKELLPYADWAQAESCFSHGWCAKLTPFVEAGKPVLVIEYTDDAAQAKVMCGIASTLRVSLIIKKRELDSFRRECDEGALPRVSMTPSTGGHA